MERFTIGPMCVTKDDFKKELEKNGLKYGYIASLYEKFKQDDMTVFRILIGGIPYTVVTDNESSYPEIQEETGKKIEPYSFEWLVDTVYNAELAGQVSYELLLRQLQRYIQFQKARQNDERKEQENCPYCQNLDGHGTDLLECDNKDADARIELDENEISFDNSDGHYTYGTFKINYCPICGRKLEE